MLAGADLPLLWHYAVYPKSSSTTASLLSLQVLADVLGSDAPPPRTGALVYDPAVPACLDTVPCSRKAPLALAWKVPPAKESQAGSPTIL